MISSPTAEAHAIEIRVQGNAGYFSHPRLKDEYFHIEERGDKYLAVFVHPELGTLESHAYGTAEDLTREVLQMRSTLKEIDEWFSVLDFFFQINMATKEEFEAAHDSIFSEVKELCAKWY
jgi:hypothetical protein